MHCVYDVMDWGWGGVCGEHMMIHSNDNLLSGAWLLHAHAANWVPTSQWRSHLDKKHRANVGRSVI